MGVLPGANGRIALFFLFLSLGAKISPAQPCSCRHTISSLQLAANGNNLKVEPGDTVCIQAGMRDYLYLSNFHGDSLHYIVFINCGGAVVVRNNYFNYGIKIAGSSYFRFTGSGVDSIRYGIRVTGTAPNKNGVTLDDKSTNFEIDHIEIANTGFAGIMSKTDPRCDLGSNRGHFTQYHTIFHDNYIHNTGGEGMYIGHSFYNGHPTICNGRRDTLYPHEIRGLRVYNNILENTHWDGIQVSCATVDCEIYGNRVTNYGSAAVLYQNSGIQIGGGTTGKCYNNFVSGGSGNGIVVFGTGNNLIFNNVIVNAGMNYFPGDTTLPVFGIFCDDRTTVPGRYFNIVNNTIVNVKTDGIRFYSMLSAGSRIANNIIVHPGSVGNYPDKERSYIYLSKGVHVSLSDNYTDSSAVNVHFRDLLRGDFRLQADSPARGMGRDVSQMGVTFDFDQATRSGSGHVDAGAFEYHTGRP